MAFDTARPANLYRCACGCLVERAQLIRTRNEVTDAYYCRKHRDTGKALARFCYCKTCDQIFEVSARSSGHFHYCGDCKVSDNTPIKILHDRRYDCQHYDDCLYDSPKEPRFKCTKCPHYKEESPELKIKRNSVSVTYYDSRIARHTVLYSVPSRLKRKT